MVTTRPPKTIVKPTALGPVANTDSKLLIYDLFQKGRVLAQDGVPSPDGDRGILGHGPRDELRLVEPPLASALARQRHGNDSRVPLELAWPDPQLRGESPQNVRDPLPPAELQRVYRKAHVILVNQAGTRPAKRAPTTAARPTKPRCYKAAVGKPAPRTKRLRDTRQPVQATNTNRPPKWTRKKRAAEKALPRDQDRAQPVKCRREHAAQRNHKVVDEI